MTKPRHYLILHKVRGEPAFDVAYQMEIGDEVGWIIPTSGHRAYPSRQWPLDQHVCVDNAAGRELIAELDMVAHLPDHYSVNDRGPRPIPSAPGIDDIFDALTAPPESR